jgi:hypothetical protein
MLGFLKLLKALKILILKPLTLLRNNPVNLLNIIYGRGKLAKGGNFLIKRRAKGAARRRQKPCSLYAPLT